MRIDTITKEKRVGYPKLIALGMVVAMAVLAMLFWFKSGPAPEVTFVSLKGEKIALADLRGKVVLVNFWATSCATCIEEMPRLVETYNKYHGQGFETIAVAMSYDRPDYVLNFAQTRQLPFTVALDLKGEFAQQFGGVRLTPTTYLIDKQGRMIRRYLGAPDFEQLHALIEKELKG